MRTMFPIRRLTLLAAVALLALGGCGSDDDATSEPWHDRRRDHDALRRRATIALPRRATQRRPARPPQRNGTGRLVKVVDSQFGRVLADRKGEAFYLFDKERTGRASATATARQPGRRR